MERIRTSIPFPLAAVFVAAFCLSSNSCDPTARPRIEEFYVDRDVVTLSEVQYVVWRCSAAVRVNLELRDMHGRLAFHQENLPAFSSRGEFRISMRGLEYIEVGRYTLTLTVFNGALSIQDTREFMLIIEFVPFTQTVAVRNPNYGDILPLNLWFGFREKSIRLWHSQNDENQDTTISYCAFVVPTKLIWSRIPGEPWPPETCSGSRVMTIRFLETSLEMQEGLLYPWPFEERNGNLLASIDWSPCFLDSQTREVGFYHTIVFEPDPIIAG